MGGAKRLLVKLTGRALQPLTRCHSAPLLVRVTEQATSNGYPNAAACLRVRGPLSKLPPGFPAYLLDEAPRRPLAASAENVFLLGADWQYIADGDVLRLDPARRSIVVLYRRASHFNTLLVTERCDNFCRMCSQPPRTQDDSWLLDELLAAIPLFAPETTELGITGGEPGLLGSRLVDLLAALQAQLPRTAIHVLSNGRAFRNATLAAALGRLRHPDLVIGIPLYSDLPEEHDYVVQAKGAYEDTISGILNLARWGIRIELRFVIHAETVTRLPAWAAFVARNLAFVDHVALMGLELMGFARANLDSLWVDPVDYQSQLCEAVRTLRHASVPCSIYNHPLCLLPTELRPFARRSISDWKNMFFPECEPCTQREACAGFFASSSLRRSRAIRPFSKEDHPSG